jgi:hypothetical protein
MAGARCRSMRQLQRYRFAARQNVSDAELATPAPLNPGPS